MNRILPPPIDEPLPELGLALEAVVKAGVAIMAAYETDPGTRTKSDNSPVTEADLTSNLAIRQILKKSGHLVLSEEEKDDRSRLGRKNLWIVDPLDGTMDFIDKTGEFTVMVAYVEDGKPTAGVIGWPAEKTLYAAQKNKGAFRYKNGCWNRIRVSKTSELSQCKAVGSRNHLSDEEKSIIGDLGVAEFTEIGSSLKVCKISAGEADLYLTTTGKMKEWDTCASSCIVAEAGGKMTDMKGNEITYNNEDVNHENGILVTNSLIHEKIVGRRAGGI